MYSNCCCSCSFKPEIIKIGQLSHKIYSNNIWNFQESITILNACTKKSGNLLKALRIYVAVLGLWAWHISPLSRSITGLNWEFFFSQIGYHSLLYYLCITGERIVGFLPFPKGISSVWNANRLVLNLYFVHQTYFLWW